MQDTFKDKRTSQQSVDYLLIRSGQLSILGSCILQANESSDDAFLRFIQEKIDAPDFLQILKAVTSNTTNIHRLSDRVVADILKGLVNDGWELYSFDYETEEAILLLSNPEGTYMGTECTLTFCISGAPNH